MREWERLRVGDENTSTVMREEKCGVVLRARKQIEKDEGREREMLTVGEENASTVRREEKCGVVLRASE